MKYTITINQYGIFKAGLHRVTDLLDWAIIDYMKDWYHAEKKRIYQTSEGKEFIWLNYNFMLEQMPLLSEKDEETGRIKRADKNKLSKRIRKLKELGLIETITLKDNTLFFALTPFCIETCFCKSENLPTYHQNDDRPVIKTMTACHQNDDSTISNTNISNTINKYSIGETEKNPSNRKTSNTESDLTTFIETLKQSPAYKHINIDKELAKMDVWLSVNKHRKKTKRFIINWLNRIEAPLEDNSKNIKEDNGILDKIKKGVAEYERYKSQLSTAPESGS